MRSTAVATVWAWMRHVAISLVCPLCARASGRLRSCIVVNVTSKNQADQAVASLRRCLVLLPWRLGVHPLKTWSSHTPVSAHIPLAAVVAAPGLGRASCLVVRGHHSTQTRMRLIDRSTHLVEPLLLSLPYLCSRTSSASGAVSTVTTHNFPSSGLSVAIHLRSALAEGLSVDAILLCVRCVRLPGVRTAECFEVVSTTLESAIVTRSCSCPRCVFAPAAVSTACGCVPHGQWAPLDADTPALIDRSARLVEPCVADGAFFFCSFPCLRRPDQACPAPTPLSVNAHRKASLKVLSLLRATRSELLCRCRRFTATAPSTLSLEGRSLHVVLHNCRDLGFPVRCILPTPSTPLQSLHGDLVFELSPCRWRRTPRRLE